jgi:diaminopimelate decarboxylase
MDPCELVARFGSPLYVYDAGEVRSAFARVASAFSYPRTELHYAIVANKNRYLVQLLHRLGAKIHANTPGDAYAAEAAGVPPSDIMYSGTNLSDADFRYLLERRIPMNVDSLDQLYDLARLGARPTVGLRLLIDDPDRPNRIGVMASELAEARAIAQGAGFRIGGLHMYAGTNTRREQRFLECFERTLAASDELPDLEWIDVGGGFGVAYVEGQRPLEMQELGRRISERMADLSRRRGRPIRLLVEPGRILVASSGSLLMTVVSTKERGGRRYVGVDATVGNIVVPDVYFAHHRIEPALRRGPDVDVPTDVCGSTTHSRDFVAKDCRLPDVVRGDLLRLRDVGAYGYAMSSHFLNRPRPAEVVIDGEDVLLTTRRESFDDLLSTQVAP